MRTAVKAGIGTVAAIGLLGIGAAIGSAGAANSGSTAAPAVTVTGSPAPAATKTQYVATPGPTVTKTIHVKPPGPKAVMTADGVYVVGSDIGRGVYHTTGAVGGSAGNCYVALLASTNTDNIIDNNNVTGPDTVTVGSGVRAVEVSGCRAWHKIGPA